ncbi:MAG: hypothetical protein Q9166_007520 [cf. Caloplaca sp. 2 TL-2023]
MTYVTPSKRQRSISPLIVEASTTTLRPTHLSQSSNCDRNTQRSTSTNKLNVQIQAIEPQLTLSLQPSPQPTLNSLAHKQPHFSTSQPDPHICLQSDELSPPLPLTRANLRKLTSDLTPSQRQRRSESSSNITPSKTSISTDPAVVWTHLRQNHIYDNHQDGKKLGATIIKNASHVLHSHRKSVITTQDEDDIKEVLEDNKTSTELTFLVNLWQVLTKKNRLLRPDQSDKEWIETAWVKDGLHQELQAYFSEKWVPKLDPNGDPWEEWVHLPRVKTPRPDLSFGYRESALSQVVLDTISTLDCIMHKSYHLPWFAIEAKGAVGTIEEAETQCARSGASIVNQLRAFYRGMESEEVKHQPSPPASSSFANGAPRDPASSPSSQPEFKPYADKSAIAFSMAVVPNKAQIYIHFAEQHSPTLVHYHMHTIGSYDFIAAQHLDGPAFKDLRKHINNILDWGLRERKIELEDRCERLHQIVSSAKKRRASQDLTK